MMSPGRFFGLVTFLAVAGGLTAQSGSLRGPLAGYVYDHAERAIRPIMGVPGASYLDQPVVSELDFASVSPHGDSALVVAAKQLYLLTGLGTGQPRWQPLEKAGVSLAAWSEDANSAVVYCAESGTMRLWSGLDAGAPSGSPARLSPRGRSGGGRQGGGQDGPRRVELVGLEQRGGVVRAVAVNNRGQVVAGVADDAAGGLYLLNHSLAPRLIASIERPGGVVLAGNGADLYAADRGRSEVLEIRNFAGAADIVQFAGPDRGVRDPVAVGVSRDGGSLLVASAERTLTTFNLASRSPTARIELDFEPTALGRLGGGELWLLNSRESSGGVLRMATDEGRPRVYFVPSPGAGSGAGIPALVR